MAISFEEARALIGQIASERAASFAQDEELLPLDQAVGRTVKQNVTSPLGTPTFDSVAIDGYAVIAGQTSHASPQRPQRLRCMGTLRAGDRPLQFDDRIIEGHASCVEVSTGAAFPVARSTGKAYDAIVPREHATIIQEGGGGRLLQITRPPLTSWHKRIASSDFRQGDQILEKGTSVAPKHIMALASVGVRQLSVTRSVRVGVVSIGSELASTVVDQEALQYKIADANGPYLTSAIREMGEMAAYLGAIPDDPQVLTAFIAEKTQTEQYDLLVTTGGVTTGKQSSVTAAINNLGGRFHFQGVAMQPGECALFAELPEPEGSQGSGDKTQSPASIYGSEGSGGSANFFVTPPKTPANTRRRQPAIFGLPGSPIASACCFRFLVTPYIRALIGMQVEREIMAKVALTPETANFRHQHDMSMNNQMVVEGSQHHDIFRHAILRSQHEGVSVEVSRERSTAKASPFASSNCWLHIPRGHVGVGAGDVADIFPFCSPKS